MNKLPVPSEREQQLAKRIMLGDLNERRIALYLHKHREETLDEVNTLLEPLKALLLNLQVQGTEAEPFADALEGILGHLLFDLRVMRETSLSSPEAEESTVEERQKNALKRIRFAKSFGLSNASLLKALKEQDPEITPEIFEELLERWKRDFPAAAAYAEELRKRQLRAQAKTPSWTDAAARSGRFLTDALPETRLTSTGRFVEDFAKQDPAANPAVQAFIGMDFAIDYADLETKAAIALAEQTIRMVFGNCAMHFDNGVVSVHLPKSDDFDMAGVSGNTLLDALKRWRDR